MSIVNYKANINPMVGDEGIRTFCFAHNLVPCPPPSLELSRMGANDIELLLPLAESIISNWDREHFDPKILTIQLHKQYNQLYEY